MFKQLAEGLAYKKELAEMGLQYSDLKKFSEIARRNGRQAGNVLGSVIFREYIPARPRQRKPSSRNTGLW